MIHIRLLTCEIVSMVMRMVRGRRRVMLEFIVVRMGGHEWWMGGGGDDGDGDDDDGDDDR